MNQALEAVQTRRSIRRFTSEPVSRESINLILKTAMCAPSACNQQPWHFVVIDDPGIMDTLSSIHEGVTFVKDAPCAILICGDTEGAPFVDFWRDDCAAATMNILLAAHSLGLGATWTGVGPSSRHTAARMRDILSIPDGYTPFSLIPLGYPGEQKRIADRFDPAKVHYNSKW